MPLASYLGARVWQIGPQSVLAGPEVGGRRCFWRDVQVAVRRLEQTGRQLAVSSALKTDK